MPYVLTMGKDSERFTLRAASPAEALTLIKIKRRDGYEVIKIVDPDGVETAAHYLAFAIADTNLRPR